MKSTTILLDCNLTGPGGLSRRQNFGRSLAISVRVSVVTYSVIDREEKKKCPLSRVDHLYESL